MLIEYFGNTFLLTSAIGFPVKSDGTASLFIRGTDGEIVSEQTDEFWELIAVEATADGYQLIWDNNTNGNLAEWILDATSNFVSGTVLAAPDVLLRARVLSLLSNDDINPQVKILDSYPERAATWTDSFDWSGVNWASSKAGTAITPDIVVSAAHFGSIPEPLQFVTEDGTVITRSVIDAINVGTDVRVSRLNEPLPSEVKIYQLPDPSISYSELEGGLSIYTNRERTAHAGVISPIGGQLADLNQDSSIPSNLWDELEGGDSGSPAFILGSNNEEVLFTTWWFASESGPYYGDSDIQLASNNAIDQLGSPYTFETNSLI